MMTCVKQNEDTKSRGIKVISYLISGMYPLDLRLMFGLRSCGSCVIYDSISSVLCALTDSTEFREAGWFLGAVVFSHR